MTVHKGATAWILGASMTMLGAGCAPDAANNAEGSIGLSQQQLVSDSQLVRDWNLIAIQVALPAPTLQRSLALVHLAMFDAVNSISRRYEPYAVLETAPAGASQEAAAIQAAYHMLLLRYPAAAATLNTRRATSLAAIPDGPDKDAGIAVGTSVAAQIFTARATDHWNDPNPAYVPGTGPASYQLTPPNFAPVVNSGASNWVPFALEDVAQFRPDAPYSVTSRQFAKDYNETKTLGAACPDPNNCARTPEQSLQALWHIEQATPQFNRIARTVSASQNLDLVTATRVFALVNLTLCDSTAAVFDAKYAYNFVRPITAIRNGDADGNNRTTGDAAWNAFMVTPPHPEYPAAHATVQGAVALVLTKLLGDDIGFDDQIASQPGVVRHFENFQDFADDGYTARIYGGMHYRTSLEVGRKMGRKIGRYIIHTQLERQRGHHHDNDCGGDDE